MQDASEIWAKVSAVLKETKEISGLAYTTWLASIKPALFRNDCLYLVVPSALHRNHIVGNSNYKIYINTALNMVTGKECSVELLLEGEVKDVMQSAVQPNKWPMLNDKYTFETFVIGPSNQFAQAAALSVAEAPATQNNPLFIYGGVGLGKTHLMHAIGNYVLEQNPAVRVLYTTCEKYTNEYIDSIPKNRVAAFREHYRNNVDILMIDDIQFLTRKERIQEEFFHNINELVSANKQIIITSDRPPRDIATLEDRLRSRFEGGLIVDITPPDLETRVAILRLKAEAFGAVLDNELLFYIAERASDNVRELEGSLKRVIAYSSIMGQDITLELVSEALKDYNAVQQRTLTVDKIMETVAEYYGVEVEELVGKKRDAAIVMPRHIAMYLCREHTDLSFPRIGDEFGGRDHSTVINGIGKIHQALKTDPKVKTYVEDIERRLQGV